MLLPAPFGAAAFRVLYRSTGLYDEPIAVSGVVVIPSGPAPANGRPIVAWTHPTTGVVPRCAPSPALFVFQQIQGLREMIDRGYVVAATDYPGLGTPQTHSYLVGVSEARAVFDSVRAARTISGAQNHFAVWGHSQGGQAALFTGLIASTYAPDLNLTGVAAAEPACRSRACRRRRRTPSAASRRSAAPSLALPKSRAPSPPRWICRPRPRARSSTSPGCDRQLRARRRQSRRGQPKRERHHVGLGADFVLGQVAVARRQPSDHGDGKSPRRRPPRLNIAFRRCSSVHAPAWLCSVQCGRSSVVERQLPKLYVVGSIPIARSIYMASAMRPASLGWLCSTNFARSALFCPRQFAGRDPQLLSPKTRPVRAATQHPFCFDSAGAAIYGATESARLLARTVQGRNAGVAR
jgi:hypothetical protein